MMPLKNLPKQSRLSSLRHGRLDRLMKKDSDILPLFGSLIEDGEEINEPGVLHLEDEMLHGT